MKIISTGSKNKFIIILLLAAVLVYLMLHFQTRNVTISKYFKGSYVRYSFRLHTPQNNFDMKSLTENDYKKLIDIEHFSFNIVNEQVCDSRDLFLLILVISATNDFDRRFNIRSTWGLYKRNVKMLFMLGMTADDQLQEVIEIESEVYRDIIQGNFMDTYRNLTYKSIMSLKYALYHCPKVRYILKVDDDTFVNMPLLLNFLKNNLPSNTSNLILCNDKTGSPVIRNKQSKWYVPEDVYPEAFYPSYCFGWYAIFSSDVCFQLYKESQKLKYVNIEDAFLFGIAAGKSVKSDKENDPSYGSNQAG
ncbi:beta-1,3-galactosyltransferase 1-like isoform X2 [Rhynchophorus ferrugineus]|uniref:beta-1,3-galactosyltransferase 1-like isoform X2 n=1 Tax=Rhynchophorus ferrugineus TaxID=354439 RepID=UPI003FCE9EE3